MGHSLRTTIWDFYSQKWEIKLRSELRGIRPISQELTQYFERAEKISPDPGDMIYFALALKFNCAIWSNDKKLKQQNRVKVYHSHELAKL